MKTETLTNNTLSGRLRTALSRLHVSQSELARRIGVTPQVIQYLCGQTVTKSKFTLEIAEALGLNYHWLANGESPMYASTAGYPIPPQGQYPVPLLAWEACCQMPQDLTHHTDWLLTHLAIGKPCFATTLVENAMSPRFEVGTLLLFEKGASAKHQDFVLAQLPGEKQPIFRQYWDAGGPVRLCPINQKVYNAIDFKEENITLIGVLREARWQF